MKVFVLTLVFSLPCLAQNTGENLSRLDASLHEDYRESDCYKEFRDVYSKALDSSMNQFIFRQQMQYQFGVSFSGGSSSSDWGKPERALANAAEYQGDSDSSLLLNDFHYIYTKARKKIPEITKDQTQILIRKGFQSGRFCDHWMFSARYTKKQVANYVKKEFELYLKERKELQPAISDSEVIKQNLSEEANQKNENNASRVIEN